MGHGDHGEYLRVLIAVLACVWWSATPPQAQNKTACELLTVADISAAFGTEMFLRPTRPQPPDLCSYMSVGPFDRPKPGQPTVNLIVTVRREAKPDPDTVVDAVRILQQQRGVETTDVSGIGDAAFWFGNNITGELHVFRGGTEALTLAGQLPLDKLKALAAKALGGTGKTGYAYGGTKPTPFVVAEDAPLVGGSSFSQAIYITPAEFLKQLKEVSLQISSNESLNRFVSAADQRSVVTRALTARGLTVRTGAPVVVQATLNQYDSVGTTTLIYSDGRRESEQFKIHNVFVSLDFYTRAVVMRGGQLHVVTLAPARGYNSDQYVEDSEVRKFVYGDPTIKDMKDLVAWLADSDLEQISTNYVVDNTPWPANGWTAAQKASADAEFLRLINSVPSERTATMGIDTTPQLDLVQPSTDDPAIGCPAPNAWRPQWTSEVQRVGWTRTQSPSPFTLRHTFHCESVGVFRFGGYYRLVDDVSLREANAVFVLNGRVFRKPATLLSADHFATNKGDTINESVQTLVTQSVRTFAIEPALAPSIAPAAVRIATGTASPDNPAARATVHHPDSWERKWNAPFYTADKYTPALARKGRMILQGTVARVTLDGTSPTWLRIYFKESPDAAVTVCSASPEIFGEYGDNYRGLIGRTLKAAGDITGLCRPNGGIQIAQSNQIYVLGAEPEVP